MAGRTSSEATWRRSRLVARGLAPAAGASPVLVVPSGHVYRVLAVYAELATSAAVANRSPRLQVSDGDSVFLDVPPVAVVTASLTGRLAWYPGPGGYGAAAGQVMPIPDLELEAGWQLALVTGAIDAADQYTALAALVVDTTTRGGPNDLATLPDFRVEVVGGSTA